MTGGTGAVAQARYMSLRQRVAALGYKSNIFGMDSVELIEQLLADLTQTTEAYETLQAKDQRLTQDLSLVQAQIFPLRKENARLARENYQTRVELIAKTEAENALTMEHRVALSSMEDSLTDLAAVVASREERIAVLERESSRLQKQLVKHIEAANESFHDTARKPARSITISSPLKSLRSGATGETSMGLGANTTATNGDTSSSIHSSDALLIASLRNQVSSLSSLLKDSDQKIASLTSAVSSREAELLRLASTLTEATESNSTLSAQAKLELANTQNKRLIAQLNDQVDFLNEQLAQRETQLGQVLEKQVGLEVSVLQAAYKDDQLKQLKTENDHLLASYRVAESEVLTLQARLQQEKAQWEEEVRRKEASAEQQQARLEEEHTTSLRRMQAEQAETRRDVSASGGDLHEADTSVRQEEALASLQVLQGRQIESLLFARDEKEAALLSTSRDLQAARQELEAVTARCEYLSSHLVGLEAAAVRREEELRRAALREDVQDTRLREMSEGRARASSDQHAEHAQHDIVSTEGAAATSSTMKLQLDAEQVIWRQYNSLQEQYRLLNEENDELRRRALTAVAAPDTVAARVPSEVTGDDASVLQRELQKNEETFVSLQREIYSKQRELDRMAGELHRLEAIVAERDGQIQSFASLRVGMNARAVAMMEENEALKRDAAAQASRLEMLQQQMLQLEEHVAAEQGVVGGVRNEAGRWRQELREAEEVQQHHLERIRELESELNLTNLRLEDAKREIESSKFTLLDKEAVLMKHAEKIQLLERDLTNQSLRAGKSGAEEQRLEGVIENLRHQLTVLNKEYDMSRSQLQRVTEGHAVLEQTNADLKALVGAMDSDLKAVHGRNNRLNVGVREREEEILRGQEELAAVRSLIADRDNQIAALHEAIGNQEKSEHDLKNAYDDAQDEIQNGVKLRQQLQQQVLQMKESVEMTEKRMSGLQAELTSLQRSLRDAQVQEASSRQESAFLKQTLSQRTKEITAASEDLLLMTRENQALTSELAQLSLEKEQLRNKITEVAQALASQEQQRVSLEVERKDLLQTYKSVIQDKRRLEGELQKLGVSRQEGLLKERRLEDDMSLLKGQIEAYRLAEQRWLGDRGAMSAQLEGLNDTAVKLQRRLEASEADCRRLNHDLHAMREANKMLNDRVALIMKRAAAAADNSKMLAARLSVAENERDALRSTIGSERQRAIELEQVAMAARSQAALAYSRERLYTETAFPPVQMSTRSTLPTRSKSTSPVLDAGSALPAEDDDNISYGSILGTDSLHAVYGIEEIDKAGSSPSSGSDDSLPTTLTERPPVSYVSSSLSASEIGPPPSQSELAGALGRNFENEPDSLG